MLKKWRVVIGMDAALVTGMFNFGLSTNNTLAKDVFKNKDTKFEDFFSKNLEKEKGIQNKKENIKEVKDNTKKDVDDKEELKITDDKEKAEEVKPKEKTKDKDKIKNTKDEENEMTEKINGLVEKILVEVENIDVKNLEVENISLEDVKKLVEVENISLTNEELLKLQEVLKEKMLQNVVEVGPQSVETEKITFNKYDDLESKLEALQERLGDKKSKMKTEDIKIEEIVEPEQTTKELSSNFVSDSEEESGLKNKDGKSKDNKISETDLMNKKGFENKIENLDVEVGEIDNKILDVKTENISNEIINKTTNMQEQIDIIKQVSEKVDVNLFEDKSEMIIKLKPDHLGKVTVEIAVENGSITAKFLAESQKVKEILESNMQDLKDHLAKQGMVVQDLSVSVGNDNRGPLFEQHNYSTYKKRQKIEEVNNDEAYFIDDEYGMNELMSAYYWPDSTVSFSA